MLQGVDRSIAAVNQKKRPKLKYQTGNQLHEAAVISAQAEIQLNHGLPLSRE